MNKLSHQNLKAHPTISPSQSPRVKPSRSPLKSRPLTKNSEPFKHRTIRLAQLAKLEEGMIQLCADICNDLTGT